MGDGFEVPHHSFVDTARIFLCGFYHLEVPCVLVVLHNLGQHFILWVGWFNTYWAAILVLCNDMAWLGHACFFGLVDIDGRRLHWCSGLLHIVWTSHRHYFWFRHLGWPWFSIVAVVQLPLLVAILSDVISASYETDPNTLLMSTSTVYWCVASNLKASTNLFLNAKH